MDRRALMDLSREELIARAERLKVSRPAVLTRTELVDEIISRSAPAGPERARARGWLGRARDLLASVVERGLHLPEAARLLGGRGRPDWPSAPPPLPTVTLAEIYAAQGHLERAIAVLGDVLEREPGHAEAKRLHDRFVSQRARAAVPASSPPSAAPPAPPTPAPVSAGTPADDGELPDRYDVDEVVAVAVDPETIYLYWEVRPTTLARARAKKPDGRLTVRAVCVAPSWDGPTSVMREAPIDALYGDLFVRDVAPGSNVRVSIGWLAGGEFEPFAVGDELATPRAAATSAEGRTLARWSPEPGRAPTPLGEGRPFAVAAEKMRRRRARSAETSVARGGGAAAEGPDAIDRIEEGSSLVVEPGGRVTRRVITRRHGASELGREVIVDRAAGRGRAAGGSELGRSGSGLTRR